VKKYALQSHHIERAGFNGGAGRQQRYGRYTADFGRGFYVTGLWEQAAFWAKRIGKEHNTEGAVTEFEFDEFAYNDNDLQILRFDGNLPAPSPGIESKPKLFSMCLMPEGNYMQNHPVFSLGALAPSWLGLRTRYPAIIAFLQTEFAACKLFITFVPSKLPQ
jgi:hypothetical protein